MSSGRFQESPPVPMGRPPLPSSSLTSRWELPSPAGQSAVSPNDFPSLGAQSPGKNIRSPTQNRKKKSASIVVNIDSTKCFIHKIPDEVLIFILANLDPTDLKLASNICKKWHQVISDDGMWRSAFEKHFDCIPIRRITNGSWRREYLTRTGLLREWSKGRQAIQFEPRIGNIDQIYLDLEQSKLYAASLEKGFILFFIILS